MTRDRDTLGDVLREGARRLSGLESAQLDARVLLKFVTGFDDADLIARSQGPIDPDARAHFFSLVSRRTLREPVAYIIGVREFWSLEFRVTPEVLIPRADSECLIEAVLERRERQKPWSVLDLGVGSGCLLCALLHEMPAAKGVGVDVSEAALSVAKANADRLGLGRRASFIQGDWGRALEGAFDIIIANPPYIPVGHRAVMPADVSDFEPGSALFSGPDGFDAYAAILKDAPRLLAPGGLIAIEAGDDQAARLDKMVATAFPETVPVIVNDLKGRPRGVVSDQNSFAKKD
ncbi:MAG: peptide chain release factor N(5)-glutamine methyltransferase [Pseudomonadota bacterium]